MAESRITYNGVDILVLIPDSYNINNENTLIYNFHGQGDTREEILGAGNFYTISQKLLEDGYIVASISAGKTNWGTDEAQEKYKTAHSYLISTYNISQTIIWGVSMGGVGSLCMIAKNSLENVIGFFGTYPVCNLENVYPISSLKPYINLAYGVSSYEEIPSGHDPIKYSGEAFSNKFFRFYASPDDLVVNKENNSDLLASKIEPYATESSVYVAEGNHGDISHFQPEDISNFISRNLGIEPIQIKTIIGMANTYSLNLERDSTQHAKIASASQTGLNVSGDFSIEFWIKAESLNNGMRVVSRMYDSPSAWCYEVYIDADGKVSFQYSQNGTSTIRTVGNTTDAGHIQVGVWTHVAMTADVSVPSVKIYINGSEVGVTLSSTAATSVYTGAAPFAIGALPFATPSNSFDGLIDEVRFWNDIRTSTEISDNYQTELVGDEAGLVGYWKLENNYLDETSNNNDLTATGSPVFSTDVPFTGVTTVAITISAKSNILKLGVSKTIQSKGSIKKTEISTISARSSIFQSGVSKNIQAKAMITNGDLQMVTAKADISKSDVEKDIQAKANIKQSDISKIISAKSRITSTTERTISAKSNIFNYSVKTASAKAKIDNAVIKTIQAKSAIIKTTIQNITSKSNIKKTTIASLQAKAMIKDEEAGFINLRSHEQEYPLSLSDDRII